MYQKGFLPIWLFSVIVVAVVAGGSLLLSQKRKTAQQTPPQESAEVFVSLSPTPIAQGEMDTTVPQPCPLGMPTCNPLPDGCRYDKKELCSCGNVVCVPSASPSASVAHTSSVKPLPTPSSKPINSPQISLQPTVSPTPTPVLSPMPAPTPSPSPSSTSSPQASPEPSATPTPSPSPSQEPLATPVATAEVLFTKDYHVFSPNDLTILVGAAVTFKNNSTTQNVWVASNPHPAHTDLSGFDSGFIAPGASYTVTFTAVGNWGYHNHLIPGIGGTVHVVSQF